MMINLRPQNIFGTPRGLLVLCLCMLGMWQSAQGQLSLELSLTGPTAPVETGNAFQIVINYRCASTNQDAKEPIITVDFPSEVTYMGYINSPHVTANNFDPLTNRLTFTLVDPLAAGTTGQLVVEAQHWNGSTPDGTVSNIIARFSAKNGPTSTRSFPVTATAQSRFSINKYMIGGGAVGEETFYEIRMCNGEPGVTYAGTLNLEDVTITDVLPPSATFVRIVNKASGVIRSYDPITRTVTMKPPTLEAGDCYWEYIVVRYDSPPNSIGQTISNTANGQAKPINEPTEYISDTETHTLTAPRAETRAYKTVDRTYIRAGQLGYYDIELNNIGTSTLANAYLADNPPFETEITQVDLGLWNKPGSADLHYLSFRYRTNLNGWRTYQTNLPSFQQNLITLADLGLTLGGSEYITGLRIGVGDLYPGSASYQAARVFFRLRSDTPDGNITNCATGMSSSSATHFNACATFFGQEIDNKAYANPYAHREFAVSSYVAVGDTITMAGRASNADAASIDLNDVEIYTLLPIGMDYIANSQTTTNAIAGIGTPIFTATDDYNGTGRTLLHWRWPPGANSFGSADEIWVSWDVRINSLAPAGVGALRGPFIMTYSNPSSEVECWQYLLTDTYDLDGDGNASETLCGMEYALDVSPLVALSSRLSVKGSLDSDYSFYPDVGTTMPGGLADYKLIISNDGNVGIADIKMMDILPAINDLSVVTGDPRDSKWRPNLVAPVDAPPGVTVYYSVAANPCRQAEGFIASDPPGCTAPNWTVVPPHDLSAVSALKFELGSTPLAPGQQLELNWPMRAPTTVLTSAAEGDAAWNSVGFIARRADNGSLLLPSEPIKTGLTVMPLQPGVVGDRVWSDNNGNGIQDATEPGVNNVRVELYRDNGDGQVDVAADEFVSFTNTTGDGNYLFPALSVDNYFLVFIKPAAYTLSPKQAGSDATLDSDAEAYYANGQVGAISSIFPIGNTTIDLTYDLGLVPSGKGAIGDYIWHDIDGDGTQNEGQAAGINGVTVHLLDGTGNVVRSEQTKPDIYGKPGFYQFDDLDPATYRVLVDLPTGATRSPQGSGADVASDSDGDVSTGTSQPINLSANVYVSTIDFGLILSGVEECDNNIDDDGDGLIDCQDTDCDGSTDCAARFACDNSFYQTVKLGSDVWLQRVDVIGGVTLVPLVNLTAAGAVGELNATAMNPRDGYIYVLNFEPPLQVYRIAGDFTVTYLGNLSVPPGVGFFNAGAIDRQGNWIARETAQGNFYNINTNTLVATLVCDFSGLPDNGNVGDFDYNPIDGFYYGTLHDSDKMFRYDFNTCTRTNVTLSRTITGSTGAVWISADGDGYAYENATGNLIKINLQTGNITTLGTNAVTSQTDGCSCQGIAFKKDANNRKIHKAQQQTYTFTLQNRYFTSLPGAQFYDQLPAGATWVSTPYNASAGLSLGTASGVGTNTLTFDFLNVPQGSSTFQVDYVVDPAYAGAHPMPNQAELRNLPIAIGANIGSDDPTTPDIPDATLVDFYEHCTNGIDDDLDSFTDCDDEECAKANPVTRVTH